MLVDLDVQQGSSRGRSPLRSRVDPRAESPSRYYFITRPIRDAFLLLYKGKNMCEYRLNLFYMGPALRSQTTVVINLSSIVHSAGAVRSHYSVAFF